MHPPQGMPMTAPQVMNTGAAGAHGPADAAACFERGMLAMAESNNRMAMAVALGNQNGHERRESRTDAADRDATKGVGKETILCS